MKLESLIVASFVLIAVILSVPDAFAQDRQVSVSAAFFPSGWMGDAADAVRFTDAWTDSPHSGDTCIRIDYLPNFNNTNREKWAGIYWQYPDSNWGNLPQGRNLTGARNLTFWARGELGGEISEFKVGGIDTGEYPDSINIPISTGVVVLSRNWTQYTLSLDGQDLSHVIGGFCWVTNENQNPISSTIYLDDIVYIW
jgi:hypothetical protein